MNDTRRAHDARRWSRLPLAISFASTLFAVADARAQSRSLQLPGVSLPGATATSRIFIRQAELPVLRARRTTAPHQSYYASFKGSVDGVLGTANFATLDDDRLAAVAKGAAILEQLGDVPGGMRFARYRDVSSLALRSLRERQGRDIFGNGSLNPIQDAGRLQSMAEAYDTLRGTGVPGAEDTAMRGKIATWCAAFLGDQQLPFQANNYQIKSGAALVTAALALSDHGSAASWLQKGLGFINGGFNQMASTTGWYRESVHYLNYSLNNVVPAAYAVRNATGVDWFTPLRPFVRFAIDTRLPDGSSAPFEEGVGNVFPHHVLMGAYGDADPLAHEMSWAWAQSGKDVSNFANQQLVSATLFVFEDASITPALPATSPTRFFGGDAFYSVLRSGHEKAGKQAIVYAALDHASSEFIESRHNTRNPLDLVASGGEKNLLVTSGGGPLVTTSTNRSYYLLASSKNVPLVGGNAPYVLEPAQVEVRDRLDTHDGAAPGLFDVATTATTAYAGTRRVARTLAMIGGEYFVVVDAVSAASPVDFSLPWRGRGARATPTTAPHAVSWTYQTAALDFAAASVPAATLATTSGYYAERYGQEEALSGVRLDLRASEARVVSFVNPRAGTETPRTVADASLGTTAALRIERGTTRDVVAASTGATLATATLGASASMAMAREEANVLAGFAIVNGTTLSFAGTQRLTLSAATTVAVTLRTNELRAELTADGAAPVTLTFTSLPGLDLGLPFGGTFRGAALDASKLAQTANGFVVRNVTGPGTLRISTALPAPMPAADGGVVVADGGGVVADGGAAAVADGGSVAIADGGVVVTDGGGKVADDDGGVVADVGGVATVDGGVVATVDGGVVATVDGGVVATVDGGVVATVDGGVVATVDGGGTSVADGGTVSGGQRPGCSTAGESPASLALWGLVAFAAAGWPRTRRKRR